MTGTLVSLAILLPLGGSVVLLFAGKRLPEPLAGVIATLTVAGAFGCAAVAAVDFLTGAGEALTVRWFDWMPAFGVDASLGWDRLSALMTLVVTGVGALIHLYSIGYMKGDARFGRFFTYLNLFIASMLILVLADNFAMLFVGWELVGLCSYLLISFWFERETAAAAGKKAFIVNRVGDVGFIVALMVVFAHFGSFRFDTVFESAPEVLTTGTATAIGLLLLVGAAGKSAQLPLYVWLPDAMEGPTPVSALIHAATMVTAGVYMVARTGAIFGMAPIAAGTVAVVGAATALYAATIAVAQTDIKRVLAYSTISQLGYMFMGVGAAAYVAGVFHLMTHSFFKALLFLGAGSVIHGMHGEQDMAKMGGLRRKMPATFATMTIAWLAISGIPPLAGFWSKDEILGTVFERGGAWTVLWGVGLLTALLTAFYMTRMMWLTFFGEPRWDDGVHPHESPAVMTIPLLALAGLSVVGGLVNTPFRTTLEHFLDPVFDAVRLAHVPTGSTAVALAGASVIAALIGIGLAALRYRDRVPDETGFAWRLMGRGYYVDDVYGQVFARSGKLAAAWLAFRFDARGIDGAVEGMGALTRKTGGWLRPIQTGFVRTSAAGVVLGAVALLGWFLWRGGL
ncbi:MAG: NADH-quinone oxidoreductase subunit L [Actinobacteria bacterium RBG_16_68_21]|nr:MAG: NADH-quinone oxidoreductase subunit L [Actinobacteria bacterium RBG_16_68_21]